MAVISSVRRSAPLTAYPLVAAVFLVSGPRAWAHITYYIVDYPANEADLFNSGTDVLSGTITTDGTSGTLTAPNIVGAAITLDTPAGTFSATTEANGLRFTGALTASATQLSVPVGDLAEFVSAMNSQCPYQLLIQYWNGQSGVYNYLGVAEGPGPDPIPLALIDGSGAGSPVDMPGSIGSGGSDWMIATTSPVPDPSTFVPLGIGASSLLAYGWRRRRTAS